MHRCTRAFLVFTAADLTLFVDAAAGSGWEGAIEYDTDLFAEGTIERLVEWLARAWESWGEDAYFSRLYITAIGAMTLETYYRYAPILQD